MLHCISLDFFIYFSFGCGMLRVGDLNSVIMSRSHFIYPRFLSSVHCKMLKTVILCSYDVITFKYADIQNIIFIQNYRHGLNASCKVSHGWYVLTLCLLN